MTNYTYRAGAGYPIGYPMVPQTNTGTPVGMPTGSLSPQTPSGATIPGAGMGGMGAGMGGMGVGMGGMGAGAGASAFDAATGGLLPGQLPLEQSYIENILRLNLGKIATIYMTFENNAQWNAKIFRGRLEAAGRDHIIISDPTTGMRYLLLMVNLDYVTFDEPLNYYYPLHGGAGGGTGGFGTGGTGGTGGAGAGGTGTGSTNLTTGGGR